MIVLEAVTGLPASIPPPAAALLAVIVVLLSVVPEPVVFAATATPPPSVSERLFAIVLLVMFKVSGPVAPVPGVDSSPPPRWLALPLIVLFRTVSEAGELEPSGVVLRIAEVGMLM